MELNPVRAGMVAHAWEYKWSSAGAHCGEKGDPSGILALSEWFEQMPVTEWKATLSAIAESDDAIEGLRIRTRTGRPLGDDAFLSKVETLLGCRVRAVSRGRPRGSKDRKKRKRRGESARPEPERHKQLLSPSIRIYS